MFKEEVILEKDILKIIVSIEKRKYAIDEKKIYQLDHKRLIPEKLKGKVNLISGPDKKISNMNKSKYTSTGEWIYEIVTKPAPKPSDKPRTATRKRTRTTRSKKTSTTSSKSGTIRKTTKKEE